MGNSNAALNVLADNLREYIETRIDLIKFEAADSGASAVSTMVSWFIIYSAAILFLIMLSISAAIGIGYMTGNFVTGFLIITGIYFILGLVCYFNRGKWFRKPLINALIKNLYHED